MFLRIGDFPCCDCVVKISGSQVSFVMTSLWKTKKLPMHKANEHIFVQIKIHVTQTCNLSFIFRIQPSCVTDWWAAARSLPFLSCQTPAHLYMLCLDKCCKLASWLLRLMCVHEPDCSRISSSSHFTLGSRTSVTFKNTGQEYWIPPMFPYITLIWYVTLKYYLIPEMHGYKKIDRCLSYWLW